MYRVVDRVVSDSFHKFIYYDDESISSLRSLENEYVPKVNSSEPIVVYVSDLGLPKLDTTLDLDSYRITIFHERYWELSIVLAIIERLMSHIDVSELNNRLIETFRLFSFISKRKIKDVNTLRDMLYDSKNMFRDGFLEYMKTGKIEFYDKVPIQFVMIDNMLSHIKSDLGLERHFTFMVDVNEEIDKYTCKSINDYVASRCTGYLSMNILLNRDTVWKSWYSNNGQLVEYIHDYIELDLTKHIIRSRDIRN